MATFPILLLTLILHGASVAVGQPKPLIGKSCPSEYQYLLPGPFAGNLSTNFIDTTTSNQTVNELFAELRKVTYIAYDEEFYDILGSSPTIELVPNSTRNTDYAYEAGVWVSDHNQVWFTASIASIQPDPFFILNLDDLSIMEPNVTISQGPNLNGGYYFNGLVYFTASGNASAGFVPAVYSVNPTTFETQTVVNSYFGLPINSIDDMAWVAPSANACTAGPNMFFTSVWFGSYNIPDIEIPVLPNAVYRFDQNSQSLQPAISRADILVPNGIRADYTGQYLYVTDTAGRTTDQGPANYSSGSVGIFRFTLDEQCNPSNKVFFGLTRSGISDGIHVDNYGRVWTGEYDGIVVRNSAGKVIGEFNAEVLLNEDSTPIANFALAGNKLVVLAVDRIFIVTLGQTLS